MARAKTAKLPAIAFFSKRHVPGLQKLKDGLDDAGFANVKLKPKDGNVVEGLQIAVGGEVVTISPPGNNAATQFDVASLITVLVAAGEPIPSKGRDGGKGKKKR